MPPKPPRKLLSIGLFAQITGLGIKALRHYDREGLLRPAATDPNTGYRSYRFLQLSDAERIRSLRALDVPLDEIKAVLAASNPAALRECLLLHQQRLATEMQILQAKQEETRKMLAEDWLLQCYTITEQTLAAQTVVSLRQRTSLAEAEAKRQQAIQHLRLFLAQTPNARPSQAPFTRHLRLAAFDPNDYEIEVGQPFEVLAANPKIKAAKPLQISELPAIEAVATIHNGPYTHLHRAYSAIERWYAGQPQHHDLKPAWERYLVGPWDSTEPNNWQTEVVYMRL
jgi:DNA-binding transcriptional MerR regulator